MFGFGGENPSAVVDEHFVHELNDPFPFSLLSLGDHPDAVTLQR